MLAYLDNAATTKPLDSVAEAVAKSMVENFGNPSSLHRQGVLASVALTKARKIIADFAQVAPGWLIFTSGATEANQSILLNNARIPNKYRNHILVSSFEHPSVSEALPLLEERGFEVEFLTPDSTGIISPELVASKLRHETAIVSIIGVHNEMGVIQNIVKIREAIKRASPDILFHVDGVQWFAKIPLPSEVDMPDFMSFSAHKFNGPRGIGGFFKRPDLPFNPYIRGGGQEKGFRSGTENLPGIIGAAKALENHDIQKAYDEASEKQNKLFELVTAKKKLQWIGPPPGKDRSPYVSLFSYVGIQSETFIHELEDVNIFISSGSACSEKRKKEKTIWDSFNYADEIRQGILRVSTGRTTTNEEFDYFLQELDRRT